MLDVLAKTFFFVVNILKPAKLTYGFGAK